ARRAGGLAISAISLYEIALLAQKQVLEFEGPLAAQLADFVAGVSVRPISPAIAAQAAQLGSAFPHDPGDRLIVATALIEGLALVTADSVIRQSAVVRTIW